MSIVIGGGDTGTDCVGTAMRQGCRSLTQFEIMPRAAAGPGRGQSVAGMAQDLRMDYGQEEAAARFGSDPRVFLTTVKRLNGDAEGGVRSSHREDRLGKDADGRFVPVEVAGSEETFRAAGAAGHGLPRAGAVAAR